MLTQSRPGIPFQAYLRRAEPDLTGKAVMPRFDVNRLQHEHKMPASNRAGRLHAEAQHQDLAVLWDMILAVDYHAASVDALSPDAREDFCDVIEVLLRTLARD